MFSLAHSTIDWIREKHLSSIPRSGAVFVRKTGQLHPDHFVAAGMYLKARFPAWDWMEHGKVANPVDGLPLNHHALVCRKLPCRRRLDKFVGDATTQEEAMVRDGEDFRDGKDGDAPGDDDDGWLRTGNLAASQEARAKDVRTVDESGNMGEREPDEIDDIPDMDIVDDDNEAIIRDENESTRYYDVIIAYSAYFLTPRVYLMGYDSNKVPLPPKVMLEDVMGDYTFKTVTIEDYPHQSGLSKMLSIHPCKHAEVMKILFDRADKALKIRREKQRKALEIGGPTSMDDLVDDTMALKLADDKTREIKGKGEDEWEVVDTEDNGSQDDEEAISVDQYLVVFLKFLASVTPTIEIDNTMSI